MTRKELLNTIRPNVERCNFKGNMLWAIQNGAIMCYRLYRDEEGHWHYKVYNETDCPYFSCPKSYLRDTDPVNKEWRQKVSEYYSKHKEIREEIKERLSAKSKGEKIRVTLEPAPNMEIPFTYLDIEFVDGKTIAGRSEEGLLYSVPPRLVKEIKNIPEKENQ